MMSYIIQFTVHLNEFKNEQQKFLLNSETESKKIKSRLIAHLAGY